jgi:hypothetical protein
MPAMSEEQVLADSEKLADSENLTQASVHEHHPVVPRAGMLLAAAPL